MRNGLIIQWGYCEGANQDYTSVELFISYTSTSSFQGFVTARQDNSTYGNYSTLVKLSKSTLELATWNNVTSHRNTVHAMWFTIGYQNGLIIQWGKTTSVYSDSSTTSRFPISFSSPSSWVGATMNIKNRAADAEVKIYPANDGGHFYPISPGYTGEIISWIAIGYQ